MRFLSNFGCKIVFMCSAIFWHQQDSSSLFKGSMPFLLFGLEMNGTSFLPELLSSFQSQNNSQRLYLWPLPHGLLVAKNNYKSKL